jgi:hypothetical protein
MFFNAVDKQLLLLMDQLAAHAEIAENFYLAGGTGLALQFGHRISIDIDLFSQLFLEKYGESRINCYHILKSFFYFDDADQQPDPLSLNGVT